MKLKEIIEENSVDNWLVDNEVETQVGKNNSLNLTTKITNELKAQNDSSGSLLIQQEQKGMFFKRNKIPLNALKVKKIKLEQANTNEKTKSKIVYFAVKRVFDILASLIGMMFILPIALIVKIAYLIAGDTHSIFYRQKRIGKEGKYIYIFKFRTMVHNADEELNKILKIEKYKEQWEKNHKLDDDPRITQIGKILRKTSLDEVPQFINVFLGDMSLIGPRPLVDGELEEHNGNRELYLSVKQGITGWWAANGRSAIDYEKRLELEYYYAKNCSFLLDIKCIFKTIKAVIIGKDAK